MEPKSIADDPLDLAFLPAHKVINLAAQQPQYRPLQIVRLDGAEGRCISRWTFTPDERARIAAGEDLFLEQLTFGTLFQPILPTVGLRDMCPRDPH